MGNGAIFSGNDIKLLKNSLQIGNGGPKVIQGTLNQLQYYGYDAPIGSLYVVTNDYTIWKKVGASIYEWERLSFSQDYKNVNLVKNSRALQDAAISWQLYNDSGSAVPTTGTSSSPTPSVTLVRQLPISASEASWSTNGPGGVESSGCFFRFSKPASNCQGQGFSQQIYYSNTAKGRVHAISFDYFYNGADGDLTVYILENGLIQPVPYKIEVTSSGYGKFYGTFQTGTQSNPRLCFHVASTSASSWRFDVTNINISQQRTVTGAPVTDWVAYTPNLSNWGSVTNVSAFYRRVGDSLEVTGRFTSGTVAGTNSIGLPSGLSIDTSKINVSNTATLGTLTRATTTLTIYPNTSIGIWAITYNSTVGAAAVVPSNQVQTTGTVHYVPASGFANSGDSISFEFRVPILGWSSSVQMSNDTDTRVVAFSARLTSTYAWTSGANLYFDIKDIDTHGSYSAGTTAAGSSYTIPVSGLYFFKMQIDLTGAGSYATFIRKNGTNTAEFGWVTDAGCSVWMFPCNAGDVITVSGNAASGNSSYSYAGFSGFRISGPSAIAASESITAKYRASTSQSIPNAAVTIVNWDTRDFDSHGAVTTGASWRFTAPISGKFKICGYASLVAVAVSQSNRLSINLFKNGSLNITMGFRRFDGTYTANMETNFGGEVNLVAGDYIDVRFDSGMPTTTMSNSAEVNWIAIERIGN